jgi:starch synthase
MYALKYGTLPVVRATDGLDETIAQFDPRTGEGNGFKFGLYEPSAFFEAIRTRWSSSGILERGGNSWHRP